MVVIIILVCSYSLYKYNSHINYDYIDNRQLKVLASIRNYGTSYSYDRYDGNEDC